MPRRRPKDFVQVKLRLHKDVVAKLKKAAKPSGDSFNDEAGKRIGKSFREEELMGGPHGRWLVLLMAASFFNAGQRAAELAGESNEISQWINKPGCYREAVWAVFQNLMANQPAEYWHALAGRLVSKIQNMPTQESSK